MKNTRILMAIAISGVQSIVSAQQINSQMQSDNPIYKSEAYSVFSNRVQQGAFNATALSPTEITSDYKSADAGKYSPNIEFKFSINLRDNEMAPGKNHHITLRPENGSVVTNATFGEQLIRNLPVAKDENLPQVTRWTIRLNMQEVFNSFKEKGFYELYNGEHLDQSDLKGVYIAGNAAPLMWDFNNLHNRPELELKDPDGDHIYETTLIMNDPANIKLTDQHWKLTEDISRYPQYKSDYVISDALYNLSLEEMIKAIEPDSTFRTGKEWSGVWTRDISYSIILSMAYMQPKVAVNSLMRKVNNRKRIIQDTGTGGAWPVSTDRMVWASAAWEVYKVTGDRKWLEQAYEIIKNSVDDDLLNIYDNETGLVKGESSFLDWREQTYPIWMQPVDIFESECLGTNAVHYNANVVLADMADELGYKDVAVTYRVIAQKIKDAVNNKLWLADKGYYAQYLYGRTTKAVSPRAEALGEALCVIWGISDDNRSKEVVARSPIVPYGIPCIYPEIPDIPPYHNNAVWPFVQSFWTKAGAKAGNEESVINSISAIYRPAALFLTNKENFVAETGDFNGTQINSSVMLWSLSGNISLVHKVLFGIDFEPQKLTFNPFVPQSLKGHRVLSNFKYRDAILSIEMDGFGNKISSFELDGNQRSVFEFPDSLKGNHSIKIKLNDQLPELSVNMQPIIFEAFEAEPTEPPTKKEIIYQAEDYAAKSTLPYKDYNGNGFIEISNTANRNITIPVNIDTDGDYYIDFRYANGNGPVNTENKCAIRTLSVDGKQIDALVFPQRGKDEWSNWGYSNALKVPMKKGKHLITLTFEEANNNMNITINQAMIDYMRVRLF